MNEDRLSQIVKDNIPTGRRPPSQTIKKMERQLAVHLTEEKSVNYRRCTPSTTGRRRGKYRTPQ